jgi:predicted dehydrogenase
MPTEPSLSRRGLLSLGAAVGTSSLFADEPPAAPDRVFRIGVISASIEGVPQKTNGHTWHFCHPFHADIDLDVVKKYLDKGSAGIFAQYFRNPRTNFDIVPFADTRITHVYDADPAAARMFAEAYVGVEVAPSVEKMVEEVDAVWLGDASGLGDDHFDLIAPALERGLPTFCDKPIGGSVAGTRKILDLAKKHDAPLMSSSLFRHQWGTDEALRLRDSGEHGPIHFVRCSQASDCTTTRGWLVYGQHPVWMLMTLCGPGVEAVSSIHRGKACRAYLTWSDDRMPAEAWFGRPDISGLYCETTVHFQKPRSKTFTWTPAIEGNYWLGHHYQMVRMADAFRRMIRTRVEPVPHQEILEVTAVVHAAVRSQNERSRLVSLAEVLS